MTLQLDLISNTYIAKEWPKWPSSMGSYINHIISLHIGYLKIEEGLALDGHYEVCEHTLKPRLVMDDVVTTITNLQHLHSIHAFIQRVLDVVDAIDIEERVLNTLTMRFPDIEEQIDTLKVCLKEMRCVYTTRVGLRHTYLITDLSQIHVNIIIDILTTFNFLPAQKD